MEPQKPMEPSVYEICLVSNDQPPGQSVQGYGISLQTGLQLYRVTRLSRCGHCHDARTEADVCVIEDGID